VDLVLVINNMLLQETLLIHHCLMKALPDSMKDKARILKKKRKTEREKKKGIKKKYNPQYFDIIIAKLESRDYFRQGP